MPPGPLPKRPPNPQIFFYKIQWVNGSTVVVTIADQSWRSNVVLELTFTRNMKGVYEVTERKQNAKWGGDITITIFGNNPIIPPYVFVMAHSFFMWWKKTLLNQAEIKHISPYKSVLIRYV